MVSLGYLRPIQDHAVLDPGAIDIIADDHTVLLIPYESVSCAALNEWTSL